MYYTGTQITLHTVTLAECNFHFTEIRSTHILGMTSIYIIHYDPVDHVYYDRRLDFEYRSRKPTVENNNNNSLAGVQVHFERGRESRGLLLVYLYLTYPIVTRYCTRQHQHCNP